MSTATVLVVDDEELIRYTLSARLEQEGYAVREAGTGAEAEAAFDAEVDLVLLDYKLPDTDGVQLLQAFKAAAPDTLVILMTAYSTVDTAVKAMKLGAYHYVNKPFDVDEVMLHVRQALETTQLKREVRALRASQSEPYSFERILGDSPAMRQVKALLARVAASPASTVLLTGGSGTGKDLAAKAIHYNSERAAGRFVNITCSAMPETLVESELFGHERGAFTDARQLKKGLLELADKGTVFLDEIGELSPNVQAKFLRFLEEKTFRRVGGSADIRVDARVIAATNRDLELETREGRFREDLYYRLRVLPVAMPPLRDRDGDVPLLVRAFIDAFNREFRKNVRGAEPAVLAGLAGYAWPGNVRELKNAVERAMILAEGDTLSPADFPMLEATIERTGAFQLPPGGIDIAKLELDLVTQALERTQGNQTRAAELLGMNRDQIRYRIEKYGLGKPGDVAKPTPE